jgi:hypothetical protein
MQYNKDTNEVLCLYFSDLLELQRHIIDMVKHQTGQEEVRRYPREFADQGYAVNSEVTEEVNRKTQQVWTRHSAFS